MSPIIPGPTTGGVAPVNVNVPALEDPADIQAALKNFLYSTTTIPSEVSGIPSGSLAEYLYQTRAIANAAQLGALSVDLLGTSNLNDKITTGFYFQSSNDNATSQRNYPTFIPGSYYGGFLFVMSKNDSYVQEYTIVNSEAGSANLLSNTVKTFYRSGKKLNETTTIWSEWKEISDSTHNHDTRYYLKTEIDTKLSTKLELISSSAIAADRVVITNANNLATTSSVTTTELGYLAGVTANIQTQINNHSQSYTTIKSNNIGANRILLTSSSDSAITVIPTPTVDKYLKYTSNGFTWADATSTSTGVTSVSGTSPVLSSGGTAPVISLATGYGDIKNPYGSKTAKYVLAAPTAANGVPDFRQLVPADIGLPKTVSGSTLVTMSGTTGSGTVSITGLTTITGAVATCESEILNAAVSFVGNTLTIKLGNINGNASVNSFTVYYIAFGT